MKIIENTVSNMQVFFDVSLEEFRERFKEKNERTDSVFLDLPALMVKNESNFHTKELECMLDSYTGNLYTTLNGIDCIAPQLLLYVKQEVVNNVFQDLERLGFVEIDVEIQGYLFLPQNSDLFKPRMFFLETRVVDKYFIPSKLLSFRSRSVPTQSEISEKNFDMKILIISRAIHNIAGSKRDVKFLDSDSTKRALNDRLYVNMVYVFLRIVNEIFSSFDFYSLLDSRGGSQRMIDDISGFLEGVFEFFYYKGDSFKKDYCFFKVPSSQEVLAHYQKLICWGESIIFDFPNINVNHFGKVCDSYISKPWRSVYVERRLCALYTLYFFWYYLNDNTNTKIFKNLFLRSQESLLFRFFNIFPSVTPEEKRLDKITKIMNKTCHIARDEVTHSKYLLNKLYRDQEKGVLWPYNLYSHIPHHLSQFF